MSTIEGQKAIRIPSKYSLTIGGEVYESRTGKYLMDIGPMEAWRHKKFGGVKLDRWVESLLDKNKLTDLNQSGLIKANE